MPEYQQQIQLSALYGLDKLLGELGADPEKTMRQFGIETSDLLQLDKRMSVHQMILLLNQLAEQLDSADFGLRLGTYQDFRVLGDTGILISSSPNLFAALQAARSINLYHNQAEYWRPFKFERSIVFRRYDLYQEALDTRHYKEMAMSACYQMGKLLLGKAFKEVSIDFSHSAALPLKHYQKFFSDTVRLNAEYDQLSIPARLASMPLKTSNQTELERVKVELEQPVNQHHTDIINRIIIVLQQLLSSGNLSIDSVARTLAMSTRSLQRRLSERGITFRHLVELQRIEVASRYLSASRSDVTLIAEMVGYTDAGNFCRAFKRVKGVSPRQWRNICQPACHESD
jgi:AraC-like DNA-binding protein